MPSDSHEPTQEEFDTDTAMHKELLGEDLEAPWPEEILEDLRMRARQLGLWPGFVQR